MKMKKIISALAVGAVAAGIATADLAITAGSKLATFMYTYNGNGADGLRKYGFSGTKQKTLFGLTSGDAGKTGHAEAAHDVTLKASGNIFTFYTDIGVYADSANLPVKVMTIQADVGNFRFTTGWNRNGISNMGFGNKTGANEEGKLNASVYKLGSPWETPLWYSNNQAGLGKDPSNYFAHAKYGFGLGDTVKLNLAAAVLSPHGTKNSYGTAGDNAEKRTTSLKGDGTDSNYYVHDQDNTQMGWGVFVNPVIGNIVSLDLFAKGFRNPVAWEYGHNFLFGGYAKLTCVPVMTNAVFGGSVWLNGTGGETTLEEWNVDLGLSFALGNLNITFNNKFAAQNKDRGAITVPVDVGMGTKYSAQYILWDVIGASFKLNDTLTIGGHVGQQSGFGDKNGGQTGTTIFVHPHVQIFASSKASISAGAVVTLDQIGTNWPNYGDSKKMGLAINVPVIVKIGL